MVRYLYDAWGNHAVVDNNGTVITDTTHIGNLNPFRYRGYYYDTETKLYFLKTRYYDPEIGRFMTIDGIEYLAPETINGLNLYAYCGNNPISNVDPNGNKWWHWLLGAIAIVAVAAIAVGITALTGGTAGVGFAVAVGALKGAAIGIGMGAVAGTTIGAVAGGIYSAVTGADFWSSVGTGALWGLGIGAFAGAALGAIVGGTVGTIQYNSAANSWYGGKEKMISHFLDHGKKEGYKNVIQYTKSAKNVINNGSYIAQKNAFIIQKTANKFYYVGVAQNSTLITTYYTKTLTKTAMALLGLI